MTLTLSNIKQIAVLPPLHGDQCLSTLYAPCMMPGLGLYAMGGHIDAGSDQKWGSELRQADRIWFSEFERTGVGSNVPQLIAPVQLFDNKIFPWMSNPEEWLWAHPLNYVSSVGSPSVIRVGSGYVMAFCATVNDPNVCCGEHRPDKPTQYGSCQAPWSFSAVYFASSPTGLLGTWKLETPPMRVTCDILDPAAVIALDAAALFHYPDPQSDQLFTATGGCKGITAVQLFAELDGYLYLLIELWTTDPVLPVKNLLARTRFDSTQPVGHNFDFEIYDGWELGTWHPVREGRLSSWTQTDGWRGVIFGGGTGRVVRTAAGLVALTAPGGKLQVQTSDKLTGWSASTDVNGAPANISGAYPFTDKSGLHTVWAAQQQPCAQSPFYGLSISMGDLS